MLEKKSSMYRNIESKKWNTKISALSVSKDWGHNYLTKRGGGRQWMFKYNYDKQ